MKAKRVKKLDPDGPLAENAARIVRVRLDEMRSFTPRALEPDAVTEQHDMRIAAKRLRYVLEVTGFCFGNAAPVARRRARDLQGILGDIHDCDVMVPVVESHLDRLRDEDAKALRGRAGDEADLDPALVRSVRHRTAYRGLEVLIVYLKARRAHLFESFLGLLGEAGEGRDLGPPRPRRRPPDRAGEGTPPRRAGSRAGPRGPRPRRTGPARGERTSGARPGRAGAHLHHLTRVEACVKRGKVRYMGSVGALGGSGAGRAAAFACALIVGLLVMPAGAGAATITVNFDGDAVGDTGACTLREAILSANNNTASGITPGECAAGSGADTIEFNAVMTIAPTSLLPTVTGPTFLDGTAGPSCGGVRRPTIDGSSAGASANGLELGTGSDGSELCGFFIGDFGANALRVTSGANTISRNRFGTGSDLGGQTAMPSGGGILLAETADGNTIGGTAATERNIIANGTNTADAGTFGIGLYLDGGDNNSILGNYIGTSPDGDVAAPNQTGTFVSNAATNNDIGTGTAGAGNLISGNNFSGVDISRGRQPLRGQPDRDRRGRHDGIAQHGERGQHVR